MSEIFSTASSLVDNRGTLDSKLAKSAAFRFGRFGILFRFHLFGHWFVYRPSKQTENSFPLDKVYLQVGL